VEVASEVANTACSEELVRKPLLRLKVHLLQPRPAFTAISSAMAVTSSHWWAFGTSALFAQISICAQAVKQKISILLIILC
jgi:hypothetical protein